MRSNRRRFGVYIIRNTINNHCYIGSSSDSIIQRFATHKRDLKNNVHHSIYLQRAWNKYGENSFQFFTLEECHPDMCIDLEQKYMDAVKPEYNMSIEARSRKGVGHSLETRQKMSKSHMGKKCSKEHIESMKLAQRGRKRPHMQLIEYRRKYGKPVKCLETGEIFHTAKEAAAYLNLHPGTVAKAIKRGYKLRSGLTWVYADIECENVTHCFPPDDKER